MLPIDLMKYLFRRPRRKNLPLLALEWSSTHTGRYGEVPERRKQEAAFLMAHGVARSAHDCARLFARYPGQNARQIVKAEKRKHRYSGPFRRAWKRLKAVW